MLDRLRGWWSSPTPAPIGESDCSQATESADGKACSTKAVVIDVRTEREFQASALNSAVNLPLSQIEHGIHALVPDTQTPVFVYCASGARSGVACGILRQLGYFNVSNAGGLYAAAAQLRLNVR